jgi:hypothetical protein
MVRRGPQRLRYALRRDLTNVKAKPGTKDCVIASGTLADKYTGKTINFTRDLHGRREHVPSLRRISRHRLGVGDSAESGLQFRAYGRERGQRLGMSVATGGVEPEVERAVDDIGQVGDEPGVQGDAEAGEHGGEFPGRFGVAQQGRDPVIVQCRGGDVGQVQYARLVGEDVAGVDAAGGVGAIFQNMLLRARRW